MRIVFMGTPEFSLNILQALIDNKYNVVGVVTQPDKIVGRKKLLTSPPVKLLAEKYDIPIFQPDKIKENYQQVLLWQPDIIITCAYGQIIPKVLLDYPKYKAINVHASLLPQYRGGAPIHRAIIDGQKKTGVTIMYMSEKMDAGDIISQQEVKITLQDDVKTLSDKLSVIGAKLLIDTLPSIFKNTNPRIKQDESLVSYAYNISPQDEKIDWLQNALDVYNHIRGLNPWPGAYALFDGLRVKIYKSEIVDEHYIGEPGAIVDIKKDGIIVKTLDYAIKILMIQLEGKRIQSVKEIFNGNHPFQKGKCFK
ncbi:MAG TPA: methionyl-tRNA formyltransferase [Haloplasmataceae bacterium]